MTTKRNKGLTSLDPVMPTDSILFNDLETIRTNKDNRWTKDDLASILTGSNNKKTDGSKMGTSARSKVEILRANSPTLKRLLAVRTKLDKYISAKLSTISPSQPSTQEPSSNLNDEKNSTTNVRISTSSSSKKQKSPNTAPLDKITYEKSRSRNGSIKQKCSLEIWLPKATSDDDDGHSTRGASPEQNSIGKNNPQSPHAIVTRTRRSSAMKTTATTTNETKSIDETSSKKSEPTLIPRVYHYEDYLIDQSEERPRSGKSGITYKTDSTGTNKYIKNPRRRPINRHVSPPNNNRSEEVLPSNSPGAPMSSKNLLANIKQTSSGHEIKGIPGSGNSHMINELMKKYSMMKKNHQELTQARLKLEKPIHDSKYNTHTNKDHSLPSPPVSDSASYNSDPPTISGRKLLSNDSSPPRSAGDYINMNTKILDRRSSNHKTSHPEIFPQTRVFSIVNPFQHRQTSASMPTAILPTVITRKFEEPVPSLHRSKTLDIVFDASNNNQNRISTRLLTQPDIPINATNYASLFQCSSHDFEHSPPSPPRLSKRSLPPPILSIRSEQPQQPPTQPLAQLVQYQNIQNSAQRYHSSEHSSSTGVSTNKVLVHLKYSNSGNTDRNCLIPD